jgi:hypothetical protein
LKKFRFSTKFRKKEAVMKKIVSIIAFTILGGFSQRRWIANALAIVLVLFAVFTASAFAQDELILSSKINVIKGAEVSEPSIPTVFNGDLRDLPKAPDWRPGDPVKEIPKRTYPRKPAGAGERTPITVFSTEQDPLLDLQADVFAREEDRVFGTPDLNFAGQGYTNVTPPDTVGEIGRNYYIQMVNHGSGSLFTVYNKSDGSVAAGPMVLDTLATGGACTSGSGDPIVLYDHLANRWLLSEFASFGNHLCVYISQTDDPISGGWFAYDFGVPNFPDYPKYAVWPDAYYVSSNESAPAVYALDRDQMLNGQRASFQRFTAPDLLGFPFQALTPADLDGATDPPTGAPGYFIRHRDDEVHNPGSNDPSQDFLEIWEFSVDFDTPANSTFTGPLNVATSEFDSDLCGLSSFNCFPQPGTGVTLDPLREVVMWRLQYRNFGSHETLVGNFVTDVDGRDHGGIRWFELRKSDPGSWSLHQEGTYAPDEHHRWMGSIAMDGVGNIALGYSVSSDTVFPGIRYVGREAADVLGTMPLGEFTIIDGLGSHWANRWGDYSSMNLDPEDDCTLWYTNEYGLGNGNWATQIARFVFDSCLSQGSAITLLTPDDDAVLPASPLATFAWESAVHNEFKLQFSPTPRFPGGAPTITVPTRGWMPDTSTDTVRGWRGIWNEVRIMEQNSGIVYWRVMGTAPREISEVRSFTIE